MKPTFIVIHSVQGKEHHDAFDYLDIDTEMAARGVHYDVFCEMADDKPVVVRQWPVTEVGAHCRGWNGTAGRERSIGFAFAGDGRIEVPDDRVLAWAAKFIREAMVAYEIPTSRVLPHRAMPGANTDCPGTRFLQEAWPKLLALIGEA